MSIATRSARIARSLQATSLIESLRPHQWVKNLLVFAPIVLAGGLAVPKALVATVAAFVAMGLVASSTYLVNDILDSAHDRQHWSKRERPIARGDLHTLTAAIWAVIGLMVGLGIGVALSWQVALVLLIYIALTITYSVWLKRLPLVDGLALATLFTLRLALGVVAAQVPPSPWLFVFSMFLFTSLSLAKRNTELVRSTNAQALAGRGYRAEDQPLVLAVGIAAGMGAVIILILYVIEDAFQKSFYGSTGWLWGFPPVIFLLICRIWLVTARGEMNDDPVRFMLTDRASQFLLAVLTMCFGSAWLA